MIDDILAEFLENGPEGDELERAKTKINASFIFHCNHAISRIVSTFKWKSSRSLFTSRWMDGWPIFRMLDKVKGCFSKQHRARFEMNSFMFKAHKKGPHGVRLIHHNTGLGIIQAWMS